MTSNTTQNQPADNPKGLSVRIWNLFSSVKFTVLVLLLLAVSSIIGTLIPQNLSPAYYVKTFGEFFSKMITVFDILDMYHSWWFRFLIMLLSLNITVCSVDRLPRVFKIVKKKPSFDSKRLRNSKNSQSIDVEGRVSDKEAAVTRLILRRFGKVATEDLPDGRVMFSEKGRFTRLGVYVVHASVLLLLAGSMIGSFWGFEGNMLILENESTDLVRLRNSSKPMHLPFTIRCDKFELTHYETGAPKEYRSDLTVLEDGKEMFKRSIIVNDPLRYKGINVFQSRYGSIPGKTVTLSLTSRASGMVYSRTVTANEPEVLPENLGTLTLTDFEKNYSFMGHDLGKVFKGTLDTGEGDPQEVTLPIRYPDFDKMRKGDVLISVDDYEERYYTGLQVTKDPGVYLVYAGFILMILGCYIAFFMSHQTLCVALENVTENTCRITVSGTANKNRMGMALQINKIASQLKNV